VDVQARRLNRQLGRIWRARYSDGLIVKMYLWSVWHDRCLSWACVRCHYQSRMLRPRRLPSISQFTRRLASARCTILLQRVYDALAGQASPNDLSYLDGKPLLVSPVSKDRQAARGHIAGGFAKGYKLHAWIAEDRRVLRWAVMPLNVGEPPVARAMLATIPPLGNQAMVLADSSYDGRELFDLLACKNAGFLPELRGIPHHRVTRIQAGKVRLEAVDVWQHPSRIASLIYGRRIEVESVFGELVSTGGLLGPLPAWVRGLKRVRRWVGAKIILYNARWRVRHQAKQVT